MTETLVGVSPPKEIKKAVSPDEQELAAARGLVKAARAGGVALTGPDGLLKAITKTVLESALERRSASTWATTSTPCRAATAATLVTAPGLRRC